MFKTLKWNQWTIQPTKQPSIHPNNPKIIGKNVKLKKNGTLLILRSICRPSNVWNGWTDSNKLNLWCQSIKSLHSYICYIWFYTLMCASIYECIYTITFTLTLLDLYPYPFNTHTSTVFLYICICICNSQRILVLAIVSLEIVRRTS